MSRQQRRAARRAAAGQRAPLRILIVGETDHVQFHLPPPDQLDDTCAALPPELRQTIKGASLDDLAGMLGELLDFDHHRPLSPERQALACALGVLYAAQCETPKLAMAHHTYAAVGVFRLKDGGYGARWAGAFSAADDGEALARFAVALKIVHNTVGAGELADYDPASTLFTLLRAIASA